MSDPYFAAVSEETSDLLAALIWEAVREVNPTAAVPWHTLDQHAREMFAVALRITGATIAMTHSVEIVCTHRDWHAGQN